MLPEGSGRRKEVPSGGKALCTMMSLSSSSQSPPVDEWSIHGVLNSSAPLLTKPGNSPSAISTGAERYEKPTRGAMRWESVGNRISRPRLEMTLLGQPPGAIFPVSNKKRPDCVGDPNGGRIRQPGHPLKADP